MKPILRYARKLTQSPARMTAADAAAVYDAGWNDDALYSTVLVTALFNFYNRLADGVDFFARRLPRRGRQAACDARLRCLRPDGEDRVSS